MTDKETLTTAGNTRNRMSASQCTRLAKIGVLLFNTITLVIGVVILGIGIKVKCGLDFGLLGSVGQLIEPVQEMIDSEDHSTSWITRFLDAFLAFGVIMVVVSALAYYGVIKKHRVLLIVYAAVCVAFFIALIALLGWLIGMKIQFDKIVYDTMKSTLQDHYVGTRFNDSGALIKTNDTASSIWDLAMPQLECCGNRGYEDFQQARKWNRTYVHMDTKTLIKTTVVAKVPITCCKMDDKAQLIENSDNFWDYTFVNLHHCLTTAMPKFTNRQGCYEKVTDLIEENKYHVQVGLSVMATFVLVLIILTVQLIQRLEEENEMENQKRDNNDGGFEMPGIDCIMECLPN